MVEAADTKLVENIMMLLTDLKYDNQEEILDSLYQRINLLREDLHNNRLMANDMIPLLDKPEEMRVIHRLADKRLVRLMKRRSEPVDYRCDIIFISLALIQLEKYDASFYTHTKAIYTESYHLFNEQRVEAYIRSVLEYYKEKFFGKFDERVGASSSQFITWPLVHCAVPKNYLPKFFEFVFDIYKKNFEWSIPENTKEGFQFVYGWMRNSVDVQVEDVSAAGKVYKLIKSTKNAIAIEEYEEDFIALSIHVLRLIDQFVIHQSVETNSSYFSYGLTEWVKEYQSGERSTRTLEEGQKIKSSKSAKFRLNVQSDYGIDLLPPIHQVNCDDFHAIRIEVVNDGEVVAVDDRPRIEEIIGGYRVTAKPIRIIKPLGNLEYRVLENDKILYSTKKELYRNVIVFDADGRELKHHSEHYGETYFCHSTRDERFESYENRGAYFLSAISVELGAAYEIDGEEYLFSRYDKPTIVGVKAGDAMIVDAESDKKYDIYKKVSGFIFECENSAERIFIKVNGIEKTINSFSLDKTVLVDRTRYEVHLPTIDGVPNEVVLRRIYCGESKVLATFNIIQDSQFETSCSNLGRGNYSLSIKSCTGNQQLTSVDVTNFTHQQFKFLRNGRVYYFLVPWDFSIYQLKNKGWKVLYDEIHVWKGDIDSYATFKCWGRKLTTVKLYDDKNNFLQECRVNYKNQELYGEFEIGQVLNYSSRKFAIAVLSDEFDHRIARIYILMQVMINEKETELTHNPDTGDVILKPVYWGKGDVYLEIFNSSNYRVMNPIKLESGQVLTIDNLMSRMEFTFKLIERKSKGLLGSRNEEIYSLNYKFYIWDDILDSILKVNTAICIDYRFGEDIQQHELKNTVVKITKKITADKYEGYVMRNLMGTLKPFEKINPVQITTYRMQSDNTFKVGITNDGDGLLYDERYRGILDDLDAPDAIDIYSYTIGIAEDEEYEEVEPNQSIYVN